MKKILTAWLLGIPALLSAQHSLQSGLNMFRAGDELIKQQVGYKDPGLAGAGVLWDFSRLETVNEEYALAYSTSDDSLITGTEHLTRYHYALQNDSLLLWGFNNQTTRLQHVQPELLLKFPVNYGDTVKTHYYAHGKYSNRLEMDVLGTIETGADAYGTMVLPGNDTLQQVLRTHTVKQMVEDIRPINDSYYDKLKSPPVISPDSIDQRLESDSVLFVVETFRWYEKGCRYPVFETVRSWEQRRTDSESDSNSESESEFLSTAFFYPPQAQKPNKTIKNK